MRRILNIFIALSLLSLLSCSLEQITEDGVDDVSTVRFTASLGEGLTKTMISGDPDAPGVIWATDDIIGIGIYGEQFRSFNNIAGETSEGVFEGSISDSDDYYAIYPYQSTVVSSSLAIELPAVQKYSEGSFAKDAFPMIGKAKAHKVIDFQALCGVLEVRLTGTETVTSIIFSGTSEDGADVPVAGKGTVKWNYVSSPDLVMESASGRSKVILNCGEGVALKPDTPTSFHIVLPPAKFSQVEIKVITKEGNFMSKVSSKEFEIKSSVITRISPLSVVTDPLDYIDLSAPGMANSYIVSESGDYCFDATVAGNGEFGIIDGMPMFADSPYINPVSAELLWEDNSGMIAGVSCAEGKIIFISTGIEGNALIAAKDADGKILWSWHIWCTDKPVDHLYKNSYGEFTMMDRNLGATRADHGTGDEWHESCGLSYQWGRKDPFVGGLFTSSSESSDVAFSVENPSVSMSNWNSDSGYWSPSSKSIYDPCPVGYMVCPMDAFRGLSIENVSGSFENGWNFIYDDVNSAWYPGNANAEESGISYWGDSSMWSSSSSNNVFYASSSSVSFGSVYSSAYLNPVRCMKQQESVNLVKFQINPVSSITSSSAELTCEIAVNGSIPATEAGFVFGTSPSPELDSATKIECTIKDRKIETTLTDLSAYTKYYVRAYVVYQGETYYSEERSFYTPNESGIVDLSLGGTSNSYIVPPTSCTYSIPLVKGNSDESVGAAASAEIIWETLNTSDAVTAGVLIESVEIKDGKLMFKVSDDKVPGNALIAVKDASDAILWSWHIWVVDFEPLSSAQLYKSGALMMDRNLGALNTARNDSRAFGLMYQWGRKDPFVGSGKYNSSTFAATSPENAITSVSSTGFSNSINYAIEYPNVFIKSSSWNNDKYLWSDIKTIYDPCPSGWRVPDSDVWEGFTSGIKENNGYIFAESSPEAFYPKVGYISSGSYELLFVYNTNFYCFWTNESGIAYSSQNRISHNVSNGDPVRCMKDAEFTVSMDKDATKVGGTSAIFKGEVSVLDGTQMDASGFILSLSSSSPSIYTEDIQVFNSQNTSGIIEVKATGLLPSTTYYVRAYAKGGHNVRYSPVQTITTKAEGGIEGIIVDEIEL